MKIGIELSGLSASDRARGHYLHDGLRQRGIDVSFVNAGAQVDVLVTLRRDQQAVTNSCKASSIKILDLSDAITLPPLQNSLAKRFYQRLIVNRRYARFIQCFDAIVVASRVQQQVMLRYHSNVFLIPDLSFYHLQYDPVKKPDVNKKLVFVWDGQGHNFPFLDRIVKKNINFFRKSDVQLKVVTDRLNKLTGEDNESRLAKYDINAEFLKWNHLSFVSDVNESHVGLAPVNMHCLNSIAKPDNKLVNYQGCGLPAIASATSAYIEFAEKSPGGVVVCRTDEQWRDALEFWRENKSEVVNVGLRGRRFVIENYSSSVLTEKWMEVITSVVDENRRT